MYLNPQHKLALPNQFNFLSGVVALAKTSQPITYASSVNYEVSLNELTVYSMDIAFACFERLEALGYQMDRVKLPYNGTIIWMKESILYTLSWYKKSEHEIQILYSEDASPGEVGQIFYI